MNRHLRVFQIAIGKMPVDESSQAVRGDKKIPSPQKTKQRAERDRKDIPPPQATPDRLQLADAVDGGIARVVRRCYRADGRPAGHISATTPCLTSECSMPTWMAPRLPPPAKTNAVFGWSV